MNENNKTQAKTQTATPKRKSFNIFKYICLGAYYVFLNPFKIINNSLFKSNKEHVKKGETILLEVKIDDGNRKHKANKDFNEQIKRNKNNKKNTKRVKKISEKQKEKLKKERELLLKSISDGSEKRFAKPQTFRYKAMSPDGKIETNTFLGVSKLDIYTFLTGEGYTLYSIETSKWINFAYGDAGGIHKKFGTKDLIFFITQLATYVKSGITLTEAMRVLSKQLKKDKNKHKIMQSIVYYLTMGESFSNALNFQNGVFPPLVINMIKAAEEAGNLDETLDDLGKYYGEVNTTRKQMISAISYPAFVGVFALIIIVVVMIKIVPQFVGIYNSAGAEINPMTKLVISFSDFLRGNILIVLLVIAVLIFIFIIAFKNVKPFKVFIQTFLMKVPVLGKIIIYKELTIFTKTFASLLKNDVFITDTMQILSKLTNNEIYKEIIANTVMNIAKGERISESFENHWAIPDIAYYMIVTGENTGELATMMAKVSAFYQEQHSTMVNSLKSLIEPLMIIVLAFTVGGILIAVILPIFSLYGSIEL